MPNHYTIQKVAPLQWEVRRVVEERADGSRLTSFIAKLRTRKAARTTTSLLAGWSGKVEEIGK